MNLMALQHQISEHEWGFAQVSNDLADSEGFVRTDYYRHQQPGRASFDRSRMNASNSLTDLEVCFCPICTNCEGSDPRSVQRSLHLSACRP